MAERGIVVERVSAPTPEAVALIAELDAVLGVAPGDRHPPGASGRSL